MNCQACKKECVHVVVESDYPEYPYRLCSGCVRRIYNYALRPREWYNLACLFGPGSFALHDDFYDENGTSYAAQIPVEEAERHFAPTLDMVRHSPSLLVDYAMAHEGMHEPEVATALRNIHQPVLLEILTNLIVERPSTEIRCYVYEMAAEICGENAADLIRSMCETASRGELYSLAFAAARCLPTSEAIERVIKVLDVASGDDLAQSALLSLSEFCSPKTLKWIPKKVPSSEISQNWGRLAAISQLSWPVVRDWLEFGRPMSLVALDALNATHNYDSPILEKIRPKLLEPPSKFEFHDVLAKCSKMDTTPRMSQAIDFAVRNIDKILCQTT